MTTTYRLKVKDGPGEADLEVGNGGASIVWHTMPSVPKHVYVPRSLQNLLNYSLSFDNSGEGSLKMRLTSGVSEFQVTVESTKVEG